MREELRDERREHILRAARTVFLAKGYARTKIVDISRAARVANSTLYIYFETKLEMFKAVVAVALEPWRGFFDNIERMEASPEEILTAWTRAYFRYHCNPDSRGLYRLIIAEQRAHPEIGEHIYIQCRDLIGAVLRRKLQAFAEAGLLDIPSPAIASRLLEGMIEHVTLTIPLFQDDTAAPSHGEEEYCAEAVRMFLSVYQPAELSSSNH